MGNQNAKQGGMVINFDRPYYYPGEQVTGSIYLNIKEAFETRGLELEVKITESVKWLETEYRTEKLKEIDNVTNQEREVLKTHPVTVEKGDYKILFQNSCVIGTMLNNVFGYGQYVYPFQFTLPQHLPGSFEYYDHQSSASIKYQVKARALSWLGKNYELESRGILVVRQSPQNFQYPQNLSDTKALTTWCFFSQGSSTLNVSYPKNNFVQDETVQVLCQLDNTRSKLNATCIKLQLFQRMTLRTEMKLRGQGQKFLTRCLAENRYAGQDSLRTLELVMSDLNNPVMKHLDKCKHKYLFRDINQVAKLQATVKSRLIECGYFLRVTTEFESCMCCSGLPTIDIPVLIYIPEVQYDINQFRPDIWTPQVMPMYEVNIPTAEQLGISNGVANSNNNWNPNNQGSTAMIQTSFEPIHNQGNSMMTGGVQPIQGMTNNSVDPLINQNGGMMSGGYEPKQNF